MIEKRASTAMGEHASRDYDLVVIGSGGAAFAAAIRARDLGRSVLMVERATVGGTCVNVGCIPSKALLADSEHNDSRAANLGAAVERKNGLVARLRKEKYIDLLGEYGINFREGNAALVDGHTLSIDGGIISAEAILVAAGARPVVPSIPGLEEAGYLTSTTALDVSEPPWS